MYAFIQKNPLIKKELNQLILGLRSSVGAIFTDFNAQWLRNMSLTSGKIFENFSALILGLGYTHK